MTHVRAEAHGSAYFVCRANQCRSPLAAAMLRDRWPQLSIGSAGVAASGSSATKDVIGAAGRIGLDLSSHVPRHVVDVDFGQCDLILTMSREHARDVVARHPELFSRTATLRDFVAVSVRRSPDETFRDWVERSLAGRGRESLFGDAGSVADPTGRGRRAHRALVETLQELIDQLVVLGRPAMSQAGGPRSAH